MPGNPGRENQASRIHAESQNSTRTKSKGSTGSNGGQSSTGTKSSGSPGAGKGTRPGPKPRDHGETEKDAELDPDQIQRITGRQAEMQAQPGPRPVDHWEHTGVK